MRWPRLGAIIGLVALSVLPVAAEGQNAIVRSDPTQLEINVGQIATLNVVLADAQNVYGIDVSATFDPQVVEVVDSDPAKDGVQASPGAFPKPDFVARNVADNQAGTLRYAITQVNPTEPVNGSGVIFSVQFRAKAQSGQSAFTVSSVELTDLDGVALSVQPESGVIRVVSVGQGTPTLAAPTATPTTAPTGAPSPTTAPSGVPSPTPIATAAPSVPTQPPAPVAPTDAPAPPLIPSPSPTIPARQAIAPPTDSPAGLSQPPTPIPSDSATLDGAPTATPTPLAVAAAEAPKSAGPAIAPTAAPPDAPVNSSAVAQADSDAQREVPDQKAPSTLSQRQPRAEDANAGKAAPYDPSKLLLIIGFAALAVAAVTAMLLVVVVRR